MKSKILSIGLVLVAMFIFGTTNAQELTLDKEVHDYGTMDQGGNGECIFVVTNTGKAPLLITNCKGSCGCTVPQCDKAPIAPGGSQEIRVKYDTKRIGPINKSVTITSNATNTPTKVIRIKGNIKAKATPAATN
ncbi:MAG: DUF1573 domain-containing protein [Flavobacteriales bacterium]|nr:DUF1573 domain-containing protein [Flavobacteriales bacterium]